MNYRLLAAACCLAFVSAAPAHADIKAFNAAVQSGDYKAASAEALATWSTVDRASPDAAAIAREFGWISMLAGEPVRAQVYARFLVEQGPQLAHPDETPAVSRVLLDWASLGAAPTQPARAKLFASLQERARSVGRDLISARAAHALYANAWEAGDWALAGAASELGIRFLDELGSGPSPARFEMRRGMATASFMQAKSLEAYNAIFDAAAELYDLIAASPPGALRDRLVTEYFAATTWGDAMYTALGAKQKTTPDRSTTLTAGRKSLAEILYPAPGDAALPRCRIVLAKNFDKPGFPFVSRYKDFGGEVTYALDVSPDGRFANPRLLGAAPHAGFADAVDDVISSWRWKIEGEVNPPACRMPQVHILTFAFSLGR